MSGVLNVFARCRYVLVGRCSGPGHVLACPLNAWKPCPHGQAPAELEPAPTVVPQPIERLCPGVGGACGARLPKRRRLCDRCRRRSRRGAARRGMARLRAENAPDVNT